MFKITVMYVNKINKCLIVSLPIKRAVFCYKTTKAADLRESFEIIRIK